MSELFTETEARKVDEPQVPTVQSQEDRLLEKVLDSGNIEVLERYIALRKSEEERQARLVFEENFAKLRADLKPVIKTKENTFLNTKYAPLDVLQEACDPVIIKHGFFYTWREEAIPGGKRVWMDISGYGYTKSNYFDTPELEVLVSREGKKVTNVLQARGIQSSYGQRYTFKAGFGIVLKGEDADGNVGAIEEEAAPFIEQIKKSTTVDDLGKTYLKALSMTKNKAVQGLLSLAKDEKLRELKDGTTKR